MKALVTGATGFMGRHLVHYLQNRDYDVGITTRGGFTSNWYKPVACYNGDLTNNNFVKDTLDDFQPEVIFHLAANPLVKPNERDPNGILFDNVITTHNLLHNASNCPRFILASSVVIYGDKTHRVKEAQHCRPTSVYGATKLASEGLVTSYHSQGRVKGTSLRLCATVGSGLTHGIVYDFIRKLKSDDDTLQCFGVRPGSIKPFCYIEDVCQAFDMVASRLIGQVYNVVPDDEINVEQVAKAVMVGLGITKEIEFLGAASTWKGDNKILQCSNQILLYQGWQPRFLHSREAIIQAVRDSNGNLERK